MSSVMFNVIGAGLTMLVAYGGGSFATGDVAMGLLGMGSIGLGLLMALALTVREDEPMCWGFEAQMTYLTLDDLLIGIQDEEDDFPIYISDKGFAPAAGAFLARINGERAIVIERAEPVNETTEVLRPVFSDREGM